MKQYLMGASAIAVIGAVVFIAYGQSSGGGGGLQTPAVEITLRDSFDVEPADAKATAIVAAANAFLATLSDQERALAVYDFADNTQRSNWSNFPTGPVQRGGVMRGNLTDQQNAAMDALLAEVMSEDGMNNIRWQLAAEETLDEGPGGGAQFGDEYYFMSFLGEPSTEQPWMLQFGGHHLAYNMTFVGPDVSFSPMLTGGEPLKITYEGDEVFITETELRAADAFMASLDDTQRNTAIRGSSAINLVAGPGEFGATIAPEGLRGSEMTEDQQALLIAVVAARLGFMNDDDLSPHMETIRSEIDETYFGWWGPTDTLGAGYFRVTGPSVLMEYAPVDQDGDPTDHAHNMYRDPSNDYGTAWIAVR